jgi:hypothetical protein
VLGFTVKKDDDRIIWLIQALSGTPLLEVRAALQDVADKHPGTKFAEAAAKTLAAFDAVGKPPEPVAGLSGDLDLFGLPSVLQTLSQSQLTGVLSLMKAPGKIEASVVIEKGLFRGAQLATLRGAEAMYQLFEKPFPGTFAFMSRADLAAYGPTSEPQDVLGLLLEGVRRHDEFKRAAALVPDDAVIEPTGSASTPLPEEDADFIRLVWTTAAKGTTVAACEAAIPTDSYRTRRLLAHWVEEGSLKAAAAPART